MKWLALFLVLAVTVQAQRITSGDSTNKNGGLVGWWPLTETNGVVFPDLSGKGNNGNNINGVTLAPGKFGNAGSFNGSSQYVSVGTPASLNLGVTFTFCGWVNNTSLGSTFRNIVAQYNSSGNIGIDTGINANSGVSVDIQSGGTNYKVWSTTNSLITTDTWYHICGTSDGTLSNTGVKIYINGVAVATTPSVTGSPVAPTQQSMSIGSTGAFNGGYFKGSIDNVRIYNRALSAGEISAMYFSQRKQFWSAP